MNFFRYFLIVLLTICSISMNAQSVVSKESDKYIDDTVMNMSDHDVIIQVQFLKAFKINQRDRDYSKKYAMQKQVYRSFNYILASKKMVKIYEAFLKANPTNDTSYWIPSDMKISVITKEQANDQTKKKLSVNIGTFRNQLGDELVKTKKYSINMLNDNELQVEIENMLKP